MLSLPLPVPALPTDKVEEKTGAVEATEISSDEEEEIILSSDEPVEEDLEADDDDDDLDLGDLGDL